MRKLSDYYDIGEFIRKFLKIAVIFIPLPIFGAGFCVIDHDNNTKEINRIISEIEKDVIKKTEMDNFTYSAFTLIDEVEKINVCIYGNVSKDNGSKMVFSSITYSLNYVPNDDNNILRENLSKAKIKYYYDDNNKLIDAKNTFSKGWIKNYTLNQKCSAFGSLFTYLNLDNDLDKTTPEIINASFYGIVK